jgi:uncharacterized protein YjbI with pentapeptide repeats
MKSIKIKNFIIPLISLITFISVIYYGYEVEWTGFNSYYDIEGNFHLKKFLWDWLEIMLVPIFIASIGLFYTNFSTNQENLRSEHKIQNEMISKYINTLYEYFKLKNQTQELTAFIRGQTLNILQELEGFQKANIVQILYELKLIKLSSNRKAFLEYANFENLIISQKNLAGINLRKTSINCSHISNAIFSSSDFSFSTFINSNLKNNKFIECIFEFVNFYYSTSENNDFSYSNLENCSLSNVKFSDSIFNNANLRSSSLDHSVFKNICFRNSILKYADLSCSRFINCDFSNADLTSANLTKTKLYNSNLANVKLDYATLNKTNLSEQQWSSIFSSLSVEKRR